MILRFTHSVLNKRSGLYTLLAISALLVGILAFRRIDAFSNPQFWAEDFVFLLDAENEGVRSLFKPMAGYLHLVPRLIALAAANLDPFLQPPFYVYTSLGITVAVGLTCMAERNPLRGKAWLALAIVCIPHTGEVPLNPTNIQWILALGILLVALSEDPRKTAHWISDCLYIGLGGMTGPFIIFIIPIFAARSIARRTTPSHVLLGLACICACVQLWFLLHAPAIPEPGQPFSIGRMLTTISQRLTGNTFLGLYAGSLAPPYSLAFACAIFLFLSYACVDLESNRNNCLILIGFLLLLVGVSAFKKRFDTWATGDFVNGDRYFFIPKVVTFWILIVIIYESRRKWISYIAGALLISSIALNFKQFRFAPYVDHKWYENCASIRSGKEVDIRINPGWSFKYTRRAKYVFGSFIFEHNARE